MLSRETNQKGEMSPSLFSGNFVFVKYFCRSVVLTVTPLPDAELSCFGNPSLDKVINEPPMAYSIVIVIHKET